MLLNYLEFGMNVQQAIDAPWFRYYAETHVATEERFPVEVRHALIERGHEVELLDAWSADVGGAQAIAYDAEQDILQGAADRRRSGFAFGL